MNKKKVTKTNCPRDYNNRHNFRIGGVDKGYIIYWCSQCEYCLRKKIKFMGGNNE